MNVASKFLIRAGIKFVLNNAFMIHCGGQSMCQECERYKCFVDFKEKESRINNNNDACCDNCGHFLRNHWDL